MNTQYAEYHLRTTKYQNLSSIKYLSISPLPDLAKYLHQSYEKWSASISYAIEMFMQNNYDLGY